MKRRAGELPGFRFELEARFSDLIEVNFVKYPVDIHLEVECHRVFSFYFLLLDACFSVYRPVAES